MLQKKTGLDKKSCPKTKVLNPKSNQCITKGTQLHKSLVKKGIISKDTLPVKNKENTIPVQQTNTSNTITQKFLKSLAPGTLNVLDTINEQQTQTQTKKCPEKKVLNPKTNHCVAVGSATYKKLVKEGVISGEELITTHKDYGKEVELPITTTTTKNETKTKTDTTSKPTSEKTTKSKEKSLIKLSPNVKKLFLDKIKRFIKKKTDVTIPPKTVKTAMCNKHTTTLPKSTYVKTSKIIRYFTVNYFPSTMISAQTFFFPNLNKKIIHNAYAIHWDNFTQRYFDYKLKLDVDGKDKEFVDYEWLNECNVYIKKLPEIDKFRLYAYSFHGDRYVNNYLRGTLRLKEFVSSMKQYFQTGGIFNPLFFEYLDVYKKKDEFYNYKSPAQRLKFYMECCKSIYLTLSSDDLVKLVENYNKNLNRILKNAPPLRKAMTLFRGTKSRYFQTVEKNKPFIHKGYMSATVDYNVALNPAFINHGSYTTCCLMVINALPGTRMLPMTGLSQINSEREFLMNTDSKVMIRKTEMLPRIPSGICEKEKEGNISVTEVFIG